MFYTAKNILIISIFLLSGCVQILTAQQTAPNLEVKTNLKKISFAIVDNREYVLSNNKAPSFEGLNRDSLGVPSSRYTTTKEPIATYLSQRLAIGFKNKQVQPYVISTYPGMSVDKIITKVAARPNAAIIFSINEWKYDDHFTADNSWYDVDITVIDSKGNKSLVKNFKGENDIPNGIITNEMQLVYKERFEKIFLDEDVIKAIK